MTTMPGSTAGDDLPPLGPVEAELEGRLRAHVETLAGEIGERNVFRPERLEAAAEYLEAALTASGYAVEAQGFECQGVPVRNLEAVLPGGSLEQEIVVVGAHYDSVMGCPGANDNGTGVAAVLELSRVDP